MKGMTQTREGVHYDEFIGSKAFKELTRAAATIAGIKALAAVTQNADKLAAGTSNAKTAAGVTNTTTAAGVATNASNNKTAVDLLRTEGKNAANLIPTP
jgi:hypothetical protein